MERTGANITIRKDGRYMGKFIVGYDDRGKAQYQYVYGRTYDEAENKVVIGQQVASHFLSSKYITVSKVYAEWLNAVVNRVKESTLANYKAKFEKHILPVFGDIPCADLSAGRINEYINQKLADGLSASYVRDIITVFKALLSYAQEEYGFKLSLKNVVLPKVEKKQIDRISDTEQKRLIDYLKANMSLTAFGILLSLCMGLRIGELCGIKWDDVDFQHKILHIRRTVQRITSGTENNYIAGKSALSVKDEWTDTSEYGETHEETVSASGYWNTDQSHSASSTAGGSNSFSNAITNSLETSERYGRMIQNALGNSETNTTEHYRSSSDSYSNTFVYSTDEETSTSHRIELDNAPEGYYRSIMVGTAYVFAVVNYNFATQQFFVNTYSVMDDQSYHSFWDYSCSTDSFTDHQNGVLPFEVPFEVNEYIGSLTTQTNGLTVDKKTGIINSYKGSDTCVVIPKYISYDNKDGTFTSVKVSGIAANAFAGNEKIVAVLLPDSINEIPDGAFSGCMALKAVVGNNIESIGTTAFQNCTSLSDYTVSSSVKSLGSNAFENAGSVTINAANADIINAACECGASSIVLNLKECSDVLENMALTIPNTAKYFKLEGAGKTLTNVQLVSDAETTEIQNVTMNNTIGRPLVTSSDSLTIGTSKITAPALAIVLLSDKTNIAVYGQSSIVSKGEYAILSHDEAYSGIDGNDIPLLNLTGNIAVCGNIEDESYVNFNNGKFVKIDENEFKRLLNNVATFSLNKSELLLNTEGKSKTYQLNPSDIAPEDLTWSSSDPSIATVSESGLVTGVKDGTATITATVDGASVSCKVTVKTAYTDTWSEWSDWSTTRVDASDTVEVKTEERSSQVLASYNMDCYCTVALNPWRRQFRGYSVNGRYEELGLSPTYGEWHHSYTWSVGEVQAARVIHNGEQQGGGQNGTNVSGTDGYAMLYGDDYYIFFITSENYDTVSTTYYKSRHLVKTPVEYQN